MEGWTRASDRRADPDEGPADAAADDGLAPDDPSRHDDERVRQVIDALIHPGTGAAGRQGSGASRDPAGWADRPSPSRPLADRMGLCRADVWRRLLEVEHAGAGRYGTRTTVVQLEIADIGLIETLLGEPAAERLFGVLAATVRDRTRRADTFTVIDHWRIAGLMPHTDGRSADLLIRRIQDGFRSRLGGRIDLEVAAGRAELDPHLDPAATMARAAGSMRTETTGRAPHDRPAGPADESPMAGDDRPDPAAPAQDVAARLRELARLYADGLVTDEEYRAARLDVLRRV